MRMQRKLPSRGLVLLLVLAGGCDLPGKPKPADRVKRPEEVLEFGALYKQYCAGCHGADGKLGPAPPLNDKLFLAIVPDEELHRVITAGRKQTLMPAFGREQGGPLTEQQVKVLVEGLRSHWGGPPEPKKPWPDYLAAAPGNPRAGKKLFNLACAACHGDKGEGGERAGRINDPAFLALLSDQALRRIVITGRPDLGMPDFADENWRSPDFKPLTSQDVADLVALLAYWRQGGAVNDK